MSSRFTIFLKKEANGNKLRPNPSVCHSTIIEKFRIIPDVRLLPLRKRTHPEIYLRLRSLKKLTHTSSKFHTMKIHTQTDNRQHQKLMR